MPRNANGLYLYSIPVLSVTGGSARFAVLDVNRYVVIGLYCRRAVSRPPAVPRNKRVQSAVANCGYDGVSRVEGALLQALLISGFLPRTC